MQSREDGGGDKREEVKGSDSPRVVILRQVNVLQRTKLTKWSAKILGPENRWLEHGLGRKLE